MARLLFLAPIVPCLSLITACGAAPSASTDETARDQVSSQAEALVAGCGLSQPAFCDTFDAPAGTGNRSGQLNGTVWGVSHVIGGGANTGQSWYDAWGSTSLQTCSGTTTVKPESDVIICNGQVREAVNDLEDVTTLAMYPKQPFDFAGRTGIIAFDVSNDTLGTHTEWPELWISDQPVPAPFSFGGAYLTAPRHAVGIRFAAATGPNQGYNIADTCPNDNHERWSVSSAVAVRNYVIDDADEGGAFQTQKVGCVIGASGPGHMNHIEVHISTSQIDVYATDADTTSPLRHIAVIPNANLSFTRGLVWLEDAHYNAAKGGGPTQHTFSWDNLGFDGPVLPRDLAFDAKDALLAVPGAPDRVNLGWDSRPKSGAPFSVTGVTGISAASAGLLTFNFHNEGTPPSTITYVVNGHSHSFAWPYPERTSNTWRTLAVPVPLTDIVTGTNTVNIFTSSLELVVANVDLVLVGAGGVVNP